MRMPLTGAIAVLIALTGVAADKPFVAWWSKPSVKDDSHLLVLGGGWGEGLKMVSEKGETLLPSAAADTYAVFPFVTSPSRRSETWKLVGAGGETPLFAPDAPEVWWLQGDDYDVTTPGGWLRVFGRGLTGGQEGAEVALVKDGKRRVLKLRVEKEWELWAEAPADLAAGTYEVEVSNGRAGGRIAAGPWTFGAKRLPWKTDEFSVLDYGATPNDATDDTKAFRDAMEAAAANGGGTVTVPRGQFIVTRTVRIPEHVLLKGVSRDLSSVVMPDSPDPAGHLFIGTSNFGIHDLLISTGAWYAGIVAENDVCPKAEKPNRWTYCHDNFGGRNAVFSENISLRNLIVRFVSDSKRDTERHYQFMDRYDRPGSGIVVRRTRNSEMVNVDLHTDKNASWSLTHIFTGHFVRVADCTFTGSGWHIMGGKNCIVENNRSVYGSTCSIPPYPCDGLYFGNNSYERIFTNNREGCTTDGGAGMFRGDVLVRGSADGTHVTLRPAKGTTFWSKKFSALEGMDLEIVDGKGVFQERKIVSAKSFTDLEIDRPFDVQPDESSVFCAVNQRHRSLFVGNRFEDCGCAIQMYGLATQARFIGNSCLRSAEGYFARGMRYHNAAPCWFMEFIGNRIEGGLGLIPGQCGATIGSGWGADRLLPLSCGYDVRDNVVEGNGAITLEARGALAEGNVIRHSDIGLGCRVRPGPQVIGRNAFEDVDVWYSGLDKSTFLPEAPRRADRPDRFAAARKAQEFVPVTNGWRWAKSSVWPHSEQAMVWFDQTSKLSRPGGFTPVPKSSELKWEGTLVAERDGSLDLGALDRAGKLTTNDVLVAETSFFLKAKTGVAFRRDDYVSVLSLDGQEIHVLRAYAKTVTTLELAPGWHTLRLTRSFHPQLGYMSDRGRVKVEIKFPDGDAPDAFGGPVAKAPVIERLGTIAVPLVESNPVVYRGKPYLFEFARNHGRFRSLEGDVNETTPAMAKGINMTCAFVDGTHVAVTGTRKGKNGTFDVLLTESDDLKAWTEPRPILSGLRRIAYNTTMCKPDGKFYLLATERTAPKDEKTANNGYQMTFSRSDDLKTWTVITNTAFVSNCGSPCLKYHDGWYYFFHLHVLRVTEKRKPVYAMRVARSQDLRNWTLGNRNVLEPSELDRRPYPGRAFTSAELEKMKTDEHRNTSDIDMCEWKGDLLVSYCWGNQEMVQYVALGRVRNCTEKAFCESFFRP